jgi:2-oxoglutarate ferredoxin oxidoreductase subunit alpha
VPEPVIRRSRRGAKWGIVSLGSCDAAVSEAIARLAKDGIDVDYCRVRAFPFTAKVHRFLDQYERVFIVEQNRDAQLRTLLCAETDYPKARMTSVLNYDGLPLSYRVIVDAITEACAREAAA